MHAFYADEFVLPLPPGHRFPMSKYRLLREQLEGLPGPQMGHALVASGADHLRALEQTRERRIPVALSMAGGYGRVVEDTVQVHLGTIRAAIDSWQQWNNARP